MALLLDSEFEVSFSWLFIVVLCRRVVEVKFFIAFYLES